VNWSEILDREGRLLLAAARTAPAADVPACPDFDMTKLVRHLDFVYRRAGVAVAGTSETPFRRDPTLPAPAAVDEAFAAFPVDLAALVAAIEIADPDMATWTMTDPNGQVRFWLRRAGHETTVHRVDAQQAAGLPVTPVETDQAIDGIGELLELAAARWAGEVGEPITVHLHATDAEGEWLVRFEGAEMTITGGHAKGDAAVRGPASDLYLWLWGRSPVDALERFGDAGAVDRLRDAASL
jgi:uncharacterized protein (TIGR03083 family)